MEQQLEVQGFDFSVVPADKRERARELDTQCGNAIQRLSYTVDEVGEICTEMKDILPHGSFIPWGASRGLTYDQMKYAMRRVRERSQEALQIVENTLFALPERAESASDDEKDHKLAELEQRLRTTNERLFSIESKVAYYKEQAVIAQAQAAQSPKTVEKRVEVTPQHVIDRQRELQAQKTQLQIQLEQIKKERDLYKRDLDRERQEDNALFLQSLDLKKSERLRANFAEVMHEIKAWCISSNMKLPSVVDAQVFEAEEWHRLEEAIQAVEFLGHELHKIKNTVSSHSSTQEQLVFVDSSIAGIGV